MANPNWVKGVSGNPGGKPKGYQEIEALARSAAPAAIAALVDLLKYPKLAASAAAVLLDRGFGKATQRIDANINVLDQLNVDQQRALAAALAALPIDEEDAAGRAATTH